MKIEYCLLYIIFSVLFIPTFSFVRVEDFFILFLILTIPFKIFQNKKMTFLLFGIIFCSFLGSFSSHIFDGFSIINRDFMIVPQVLKYLFVFIVFKNYWHKLSQKIIVQSIYYFSLVIFLIPIFQYFNLLNINSWLTPLYNLNFDSDYLDLVIYQLTKTSIALRVSGTFSNPNYFGFVLCSLLLFNYYLQKNFNNKVLFLTLISFIAITTLQSRTSLFAYFFIIFLNILYLPKKNRNYFLKTILIILIPICSVFLGYMVKTKSNFLERIELSSESTDKSYDSRLNDLVVPIFYLIENPKYILFGRGPSKSEIRSDSHNGFSWFLLRFGLIGLFLYLKLISFSRDFIKKTQRNYNSTTSIHQSIFVNSAMFLWIIYELTSNIFKEPRLMLLNMIFIAIVISNTTKNNE